jgi:hypothetical protein
MRRAPILLCAAAASCDCTCAGARLHPIDPKRQRRRDNRLGRRAEGFLTWLRERAAPHEANAPFLANIGNMEALREHATSVSTALRQHPATNGQLEGPFGLAASVECDLSGSYIPLVTFTDAVAGATLTDPGSCTALFADTAKAANWKPERALANTTVAALAPGYRGPRWASAPGAEQGGLPWLHFARQLRDHYAAEQVRKRHKSDSSTYAESVMEVLVATALERSALHRWYDRTVPRSTSRHLTFNFLQEVAIGEHAAALAALQRAHGRPTDHVIDFGGGNGLLAYVTGQRLLVDDIVVDKFRPGFCVEDAEVAADCALRHRRVTKYIQDVNWAADIVAPPHRCIAVSKHLCGSGIDHTLRLFASQDAWPNAVALSSCCHHKCRIEEYIDPAYLAALGINDQATLDAVARKAGWLASENPAWLQLLGATVEAMLDLGRVLWLRQHGYAAFTVTCMSSFLSPRNKMLIGWKHGGLLSV